MMPLLLGRRNTFKPHRNLEQVRPETVEIPGEKENVSRYDSQAVLDQRSRDLRLLAIEALDGGQRGHIGSTMSLIEIFRVLYDSVASVDPSNPTWPNRDRIILSKGHGCIAGVRNLRTTVPAPSVHVPEAAVATGRTGPSCAT